MGIVRMDDYVCAEVLQCRYKDNHMYLLLPSAERKNPVLRRLVGASLKVLNYRSSLSSPAMDVGNTVYVICSMRSAPMPPEFRRRGARRCIQITLRGFGEPAKWKGLSGYGTSVHEYLDKMAIKGTGRIK